MFSALRQGNTFYILEKSTSPILKRGQVTNVTPPKPRYNNYTPGATYGLNPEMVVDIDVTVNGEKLSFKQVPSNAVITTFDQGKVIISESKEAIIAEVDGLLQTSKQIVDSVDAHKKAILSYEQMLKDLNPSYAQISEQDSAIKSLTEQVNNMETKFNDLSSNINKILTLVNKADN